MEYWSLIILIGYLVLFIALSIGGILLVRSRRKTKWPFKESEKLLRGPGEGLQRRVAGFDEKFMLEYFGSIVAALLVWPVVVTLARLATLPGHLDRYIAMATAALIAILAAWRVIRLWKERANYYLGWFGERLVAEKLSPLQRKGYHVFHDVPGEPGKEGFNVDHVVVGPTGVAVIEVKTRRKGAARPGRKEHEVLFDGSKLNWPWGQDRKSVTQTVNEADWIRKWIIGHTGLRVAPIPILTIPGWFVRESPSPSLRVINPDFLEGTVIGNGEVVLKGAEVDLIALQLEIHCRDVED